MTANHALDSAYGFVAILYDLVAERHIKMEDHVLVTVCQARSLGAIFGVYSDGIIHQLNLGTIRHHTSRLTITEDIDFTTPDTIYLPNPTLDFLVSNAEVSSNGKCILLKGITAFGLIQLDRKLQTDVTKQYTVPCHRSDIHSTEADVARVTLFGDSVAVLRVDGSLAIHTSHTLRFAERRYTLKSEAQILIGLPDKPRAKPIDLANITLAPWAPFSLLVLYEDGCIYLLCPVIPTGYTEVELTRSASRLPIDRDLLKTLFKEVMGTTLKYPSVSVPYLYGPLNTGLQSEWNDLFESRKTDRAVALSCSAGRDGIIMISTATMRGVVYTHILLGAISPRVVAADEAYVSLEEVRLCPPMASGTQLRLIEVCQLGFTRNEGLIRLWQLQDHPEMMYCQSSTAVYRIDFRWMCSLLSDVTVESYFQKSSIWRCTRADMFIGCYHDLDASVTVFLKDSHTIAVFYRPKIVDSSYLSSMQLISLQDKDRVPIPPLDNAQEESIFSILTDPGLTDLKKAIEEYQILKLADDVELSIQHFERIGDGVCAQMKAIEREMKAIKPLTESSAKLCQQSVDLTRRNDKIRFSLQNWRSYVSRNR